MNTEQIETFLYVSLTKNFSKTGELLYISQPTVSARIGALEQEIGFKLFYRNRKDVVLTKNGELFFPYAEKALKEIQAGLSAVDKMNNKSEGNLDISVVLTMLNYFSSNFIMEFHEAFPKVKLTLHTGHSHNILDMVLNYEVYIGISRAVNHPKIESIDLIRDKMVLVTYNKHHFTSKKETSIKEVSKEPLILYNRDSIDRTMINNVFNALNIKPNAILETDNIELIKQMIKKEMGIGFLPKSSIESDLKTGQLSMIEITDLPEISRPFQLIFLKQTKIKGILKEFVDFAIAKLS